MSGTGARRVHCCIPECRRSFRERPEDIEHGHDEVMCGRCYRTAEPRLVANHKLIHRRMRRVTRLLHIKAIQGKPGFGEQIESLDGLFRRACARSWAKIKFDVEMKSRLCIEGTAGWLAAKRASAA